MASFHFKKPVNDITIRGIGNFSEFRVCSGTQQCSKVCYMKVGRTCSFCDEVWALKESTFGVRHAWLTYKKE